MAREKEMQEKLARRIGRSSGSEPQVHHRSLQASNPDLPHSQTHLDKFWANKAARTQRPTFLLMEAVAHLHSEDLEPGA